MHAKPLEAPSDVSPLRPAANRAITTGPTEEQIAFAHAYINALNVDYPIDYKPNEDLLDDWQDVRSRCKNLGLPLSLFAV
jgi:hypothetical protein